jgi:uncharacterized protein
VSLTSVGSGSPIIASLVVLHPSTPMRRIVGSDMVHALFLAGISALGHLWVGNINVPSLGALLVGSLSGVWVGGRVSAVFPERILQPNIGCGSLLPRFRVILNPPSHSATVSIGGNRPREEFHMETEEAHRLES